MVVYKKKKAAGSILLSEEDAACSLLALVGDLQQIADKNFKADGNEDNTAQDIRLVGKPGPHTFSKVKSCHGDNELP